MRYMASPCLFIYNYIYTSRFAAAPAEGRRSLHDLHHLPHTHRKHLNTLISENTLVYSGNPTNAHIHNLYSC